eukprot:1160926-Pelagomonas_calceolata.AAC.5
MSIDKTVNCTHKSVNQGVDCTTHKAGHATLQKTNTHHCKPHHCPYYTPHHCPSGWALHAEVNQLLEYNKLHHLITVSLITAHEAGRCHAAQSKTKTLHHPITAHTICPITAHEAGRCQAALKNKSSPSPITAHTTYLITAN